MPDQDLDERAARAMGWTFRPQSGMWRSSDGGPAGFGDGSNWLGKIWSPSTDHNHAHLLYDEVERRGKAREATSIIRERYGQHPAHPLVFDGRDLDTLIMAVQALTASQLTEVYCEVLEADNERAE